MTHDPKKTSWARARLLRQAQARARTAGDSSAPTWWTRVKKHYAKALAVLGVGLGVLGLLRAISDEERLPISADFAVSVLSMHQPSSIPHLDTDVLSRAAELYLEAVDGTRTELWSRHDGAAIRSLSWRGTNTAGLADCDSIEVRKRKGDGISIAAFSSAARNDECSVRLHLNAGARVTEVNAGSALVVLMLDPGPATSVVFQGFEPTRIEGLLDADVQVTPAADQCQWTSGANFAVAGTFHHSVLRYGASGLTLALRIEQPTMIAGGGKDDCLEAVRSGGRLDILLKYGAKLLRGG